MSEFKHTPGPWTISGQLINGAPEPRPNPKVKPYPHTVTAVCWNFDGDRGATGDLPWPIAEANARLIAAAPELLEACRAAQNWLREYHTQNGSPMDEGIFGLDDQLVAAIARATKP